MSERPATPRLLVLALAVCLPLAASACGGGSGESGPSAAAATAQGVAASRCRDVPRALVETIAGRLTAQETLRNAKAVKSHDFERLWFISAEIDGPGLGLGGSPDIGTWAKTGPLAASGGLILSVDSVLAQQLSGWPPGDNTYAGVTMDNDGAGQSRDCVGAG